MHLVRPSWLVHQGESKEHEIYSLSISPDGSRLASGGQDCKVRIWSTESVNKTLETNEPAGPKHLCSMSNHAGAVTVVRFSPSGTYLASGSDDKVVLIWAKDDTRAPRQEFGQKGEADSEVWVAQKRLIGHENDVQDLAWSPDGSLLVTVGLDSHIIIWSGTTFEQLRVLNPHSSHVKGITFDPANKYFATASDDRSVKIFRYHRTATEFTFQVEQTVTDPFHSSPLCTYFRRLSWSPDGTLIAAPNATNGPVSTVALISRGTWDTDISLIGHDAPCEVVAFCSRVFTPQTPEDRKKDYDTVQVIATASQDKSLAIWNSASARPIVVAKNVTEKAITDIVWNAQGDKLYASSLDGTIIMVAFEPGELGYPLSQSEVDTQLTRYGGNRDATQIAESVEQARLEEVIPQEEKNVNEQKMDKVMGGNGTASEQFSAQSINTNGNGAVAEKPVAQAQAAPPAPAPAPAPAPTPPKVNVLNVSKQNVTYTKDGKKRLKPQLITSNGPAPQPQQQQQRPPSSSGSSGPSARLAEQNVRVMEVSQPTYALPKGGMQTLIIGTKRKNDTEEDGGANNNHPPAKKQKNGVEEVPEFIKPAVISPASSVAAARLGVPTVKTIISTGSPTDEDSEEASSASSSSSVLEIRNGKGNEHEPTRLTVTKRGEIVFMDFLPRHGHLAAGRADTFWAASTEDGALYLYSPSGRRLLPCIVLGSAISFLESQGVYLLAITCTGMVHVWNVREQRAMHEPVSLAPILDSGMRCADNGVQRAPSVTQCAVSQGGHVIITLSNGAGYTYNRSMFTWSRISEEWWYIGSQFWDSSNRTTVSGVVGMVERRTNDAQRRQARGHNLQKATRNRVMQGGYEAFESTLSTAHLENKIGAAIMLESSDELQDFMLTYVYQLADQTQLGRLEEVCKELLGPVITNGTSDWSPTICGVDKHELLGKVVDKIGGCRQAQRVVTKYAEALGKI